MGGWSLGAPAPTASTHTRWGGHVQHQHTTCFLFPTRCPLGENSVRGRGAEPCKARTYYRHPQPGSDQSLTPRRLRSGAYTVEMLVIWTASHHAESHLDLYVHTGTKKTFATASSLVSVYATSSSHVSRLAVHTACGSTHFGRGRTGPRQTRHTPPNRREVPPQAALPTASRRPPRRRPTGVGVVTRCHVIMTPQGVI